MSTIPEPSPDLLAIDLCRVHVEGMGIDELAGHVEALRAVLVGLVQSRHLRPQISFQAAANVDHLLRKVQANLSHSLDVLSDLRVAAAWLDAARQERGRAGSECRPSRLDV